MTLDDVLEELAATRARLHGLQVQHGISAKARRREAASQRRVRLVSLAIRAPVAYAWLAAGKPLRAVEGLRDLDHALRLARQWASDNGAPWPPRQETT